MLRGIDVSSHQPQINWATVAAINDFAICKATGGTEYLNPEYKQQIAGARAAGLVVGHYHYAFESSLHSMPGLGPQAEADYFLSKADIKEGELVALDFEDHYWDIIRPGAGWLEDWAYRWLQHVEKTLGFRPLFYAYPYYITNHGLGTARLAQYPLWLARYWTPYATKPWPTMPASWKWSKLTIWQWSGGTTVTGIPNETDENLFDGTMAELKALGKPAIVGTERDELLRFGDSISLAVRGLLQQEGVVDLTEFGGSKEERLARYERLVCHRLNGSNQILTLDLWDRLRKEGKVVQYV